MEKEEDRPYKDWTDQELWTGYARVKDERWYDLMEVFTSELRIRGLMEYGN
jgi:hypothetical protein